MLRRKNKQNNKIRTGSFTSKYIPVRENGDNYFYVENFEQTNEKECREFDKYNQMIYEKYMRIYNKITKQLDDCPFKLDREPEPPRSPNNYESLIKWRSMNVSKNVSHQSICLIYLLSQGFLDLSLDYNKDGLIPSDIIKKAEELSKKNIDLMKLESYKFLDRMKSQATFKSIRSNNNNNTIRYANTRSPTFRLRKGGDINKRNKSPVLNSYSSGELSINKTKPKSPQPFLNVIHPQHTPVKQSQTKIIINNSKSVGKKNRKYRSESDSLNSDSSSDNQIDYGFGINNMKCKNPEHHSITKKINHFDKKNTIYPHIEESNINFLKPTAPPPPPEYHTTI